MIKSFRELEVWQKSHQLVLEIYRLTSAFPKEERFGVVSQRRRAAASTPANIAEGFGRRSTKELLQFLIMANGSLEETRYFVILSSDLSYLPKHIAERLDAQLTTIAQMMAALSRSLKAKMVAGFSTRATGHGPRVTH
jgi:four helix bundle protein